MKNIKLIFICVIAFPCGVLQAQKNVPRPTANSYPTVFSSEIKRQLIDSIRSVLVRNYIFLDKAILMADYLEKQYKKGAYDSLTNPIELNRKLVRDLGSVHRDVHFRVIYAPDAAKELLAPLDAAKQGKKDSVNAANHRNDNYYFHRVEILAGNIGYVKWDGFTEYTKEARPTFTAAFRFVMNTKALIVDLRENRGGSPEMVSQAESYFFPEKIHMNDIVYRSPDSTVVFWTDPRNTDDVLLSMPVYILTSKRTVSGAEDFAYAMQSVKRAIVIGDTTAGGAHPTGMYNIGFGFIGAIPVAKTLNPYTHTDWEGTGVYPDVQVIAVDALRETEKIIFSGEISKAKTEVQKRRLEWTMRNLMAYQSEEIQDSVSLVPYRGTYDGGLVFFVQGHYLHCKNKQRSNRTFKLRHIEADQFVLDERTEVEFQRDKKGNVTSCRLLTSDGSVQDRVKQ